MNSKFYNIVKLECKCGNEIELNDFNLRKCYPKCNRCGNRLVFYCINCGEHLQGKPKIYFDGSVYCYSCAKEIISKSELENNEKNKKIENENQDIGLKWNNKCDDYCHSETIYIVPLVTLIFIIIPFLIWGSFGAGFIIIALGIGYPVSKSIQGYLIRKKREEFIKFNPEPNYREMKLIEYFPLLNDGFIFDGTNLREKIIERDHNQCQVCKKEIKSHEIEVHHIIPKAKGGKDYPSNLISLCVDCHIKEKWFGHYHYKIYN